jgi:hypothetical protein
LNFEALKVYAFIGEAGLFWFQEDEEGITFFSSQLLAPIHFTFDEFDEALGESDFHLIYMAAKLQQADYGIYILSESQEGVEMTKIPVETISFDFMDEPLKPIFSITRDEPSGTEMFLWEVGEMNPITSKTVLSKDEFHDFYNYVENLWENDEITEGEFDLFKASVQLALQMNELKIV